MTKEKTISNQVTIVLRGKEYTFPNSLYVHQVFKRMGLDSESYLVVRNGEVITEDTLLNAGDQVRVVPVISGGNDSL